MQQRSTEDPEGEYGSYNLAESSDTDIPRDIDDLGDVERHFSKTKSNIEHRSWVPKSRTCGVTAACSVDDLTIRKADPRVVREGRFRAKYQSKRGSQRESENAKQDSDVRFGEYRLA